MPSDARCGSRGPPGDLHGPLGVNNADSNPRSDSRGPPGDLHGTARQVTRCFLLEALENAPQGEDNQREREREIRNKHTSYRRSIWPGPLALKNAERCPVRFPGGPGNLHGPLGVHTAGSNPLGDAGGPGRSARHCRGFFETVLFVEAKCSFCCCACP